MTNINIEIEPDLRAKIEALEGFDPSKDPQSVTLKDGTLYFCRATGQAVMAEAGTGRLKPVEPSDLQAEIG